MRILGVYVATPVIFATMKLLMQYLGRYKLMIILAILLAAVNQSFSLLNPMIAGKILDKFVNHPFTVDKEGLIQRDLHTYLMQALVMIGAIMGVAMVSRIAKNFQDYVVNVVIQKYGAQLYTDGLRHALRLPYQEFEDQSSGHTLSVLQKVRADCEKFINSFFNVLLPTIVGIVFVIVYAFALSPLLPLVYVGGAAILGVLTSTLSKKIKAVQKNIVRETNALAGSTTESLRKRQRRQVQRPATGAEEGAQHPHYIFYSGHFCELFAAGNSNEPFVLYIQRHVVSRTVSYTHFLFVLHLRANAGDR